MMDSTPTAASGPPGPGRGAPPWLAMALGLLLLLSVLGNGLLLLLAGGLALTSSPGRSGDLEEITLEGASTASQKIVLLPIAGMILEEGDLPGAQRTVSQVREVLKAIRDDDEVAAVILDINSPGGGVTASDQIYHELKRFREETEIPIVSLFGDMATSGGYYVAMASDHLVAHPTTITGSIGVISQFPLVEELLDKIGVEIRVVSSLDSRGGRSFKDMGSPFRQMSAEERRLLQGMITQMWERFTQVVAEGREGKLTAPQVRALADGRIFTGREALALKLVDEIGYREDALKKARALGGAPEARLVGLKRRARLWELISARGAAPVTPAEALARALQAPSSRSPRLLYLWNGA